MKSILVKRILPVLFVTLFYCAAFNQTTSISQLKFLNEYVVSHNYSFKNTTVGGLSGIDYDVKNDLYYLISDDRSAINPARFYTAKVIINNNKIDSVIFVDVKNMLQQDGSAYPSSKQNPVKTPDPEDMRFNSINHQLIWTSEGERIVRTKDTVLENPAITVISTDGKYIDTFPLPKNLLMHATESGPRQNGVLEGLSFTKNFKTLFVNLEEPLYEDGPRADVTENNPFIRIYKFDVASKKNLAQYAYKLDKVAYPASPENAFKINGIPDILSIGKKQLLVIERSFSTGRLPCTIKIFTANLKKATNVKNIASLSETKSYRTVSKKLLLNMDDLGIYTDNIEGVTFGPDLPNGHKSLVFVADNNFNSFEKTQFLLFEIIP
jgi:hypothetical protein